MVEIEDDEDKDDGDDDNEDEPETKPVKLPEQKALTPQELLDIARGHIARAFEILTALQ